MLSCSRIVKLALVFLSRPTTLIMSLVLLSPVLSSSGLAEIIPADRRINWDPGVRGLNGAPHGIPVPSLPTDACPTASLPTSATAATIQSALNTCKCDPATTANCKPRVLTLAPGVYNINAKLTIPSYVILRGAGIRNDAVTPATGTTLVGASTFSGNVMISFDNNFNESWGAAHRTLVSPSKGTATITTSGAHGWTAGDIVLIDMVQQPTGNPPINQRGTLGNCSWCGRLNRPIGQWVKVIATPSTTTATIDPPLYFSYGNSPEGTEMTGLTHYAGVEDLTLNNLSSRAQDTVGVFGAINSWLKGVEMRGNNRRAVWGFGALWFTFQGCRITGGIPIGSDNNSQYKSDSAYGIFFGPHFTASLITDNIFDRLTMGIAYEGAASGNVASYNFMHNMWWENTGDSPRRFGPLMHGPHPFMNLFEGNWSSTRIRHDEYWGTSSHYTYLRNRIFQTDRGAGDSQTWTVDIERNNWYNSLVGNVFGNGPIVKENRYEKINGASAPYADSNSTIWKIGYESLGSDNTNYDSGTLTTMIRWGNWTNVTPTSNSGLTNDSTISGGAGVVYHTGNGVVNETDRTIPNSYYLTTKPSWFGSYSWPPYGPEFSASYNACTVRIPAHQRYIDLPDSDAAMVQGCSAQPPGNPPAPPSNLSAR